MIKMKSIVNFLTLILLFASSSLFGQIEEVIVETYYVSDANDATDMTGENYALEEGSVTYRIYVDLEENVEILKIYGEENHPIEISSTENFFNNLDRGESFGYNMNDARFDENTVCLDSWITLGFCSRPEVSYMGILKEDDPDGSFVGGSNNDGGSAGIVEGLLSNEDASAGIPITTSDGYIPVPDSLNAGLANQGIEDFLVDTTIFQLEEGNTFFSTAAEVSSNIGVSGPTEDNIVLLAQLTTKGELSFKINLRLQFLDVTSGNTIVQNYVALDTLLGDNDVFSPWLCYPFAGGCTNPDFLEYNPAAIIDDGSCLTPIVLGCTDPDACNFDGDANFNVQELCCYENDPENCYTDISLICDISSIADINDAVDINLYPNPARNELNISLTAEPGFDLSSARYYILDANGKIISSDNLVNYNANSYQESINIEQLSDGIYFFHLVAQNQSISSRFIKTE